MRKDMAKVIVERPRVGSRHGAVWRGRRVQEHDDDGAPLPVRFHRRRQDTKYLNENLAPLRRYLEAQVGRPWDKVYAEICANLTVRSTVQQHVRDHLEGLVAVRCRMIDGKLHGVSRYGSLYLVDGRWRPGLYVHPRTGLLTRVKPRKP